MGYNECTEFESPGAPWCAVAVTETSLTYGMCPTAAPEPPKPPEPERFCLNGVTSGGSCCPSNCKKCGGPGCDKRFHNSKTFCCDQHIKRTQKMCQTPQDTRCWYSKPGL